MRRHSGKTGNPPNLIPEPEQAPGELPVLSVNRDDAERSLWFTGYCPLTEKKL